MSYLIFGCGYLGARVAHRWRRESPETYAVTRFTQRATELEESGLRACVADIMKPQSLTRLPPCETILFAVGYDRQSGHSLTDVYVDGFRHVLDSLPDSVERIIYISSTGVYGQNDGSWVREDSACNPQREGGRACLRAEQLLLDSPWGEKSTVLRLAGIYGPQRVPQAKALNKAEPLKVRPDSYLNLVHVEDAADVVTAVAVKADARNLYVVSDGHPVLRQDYYNEASRLLGTAPPRFEPPDSASEQGRGSGAGKRIDNRLLVQDLEISFRYPSYKEGLAAAISEMSD